MRALPSLPNSMKKSCVLAWLLSLVCALTASAFDGPLRVHPKNPRYFTDNSGKAIYLTGSHTWNNFQEILPDEGGSIFDYDAYLEMMAANGHNFMRLWTWEQTQMGAWTRERLRMEPMPYLRTGPGVANDGLPKFDLTKFNPEYFARLRQRLIQAREKGIYAAVMLFQGWSLNRRADSPDSGNPFPYLPVNAANNINGVSAPESQHDFDDRPTLHSLKAPPELLAAQEAYIRKTIETVNDLDNVLYEVINEGGSIEWQHHIVNFVKQIEAGLPKQHPIGMTYRWEPKHPNELLFVSPSDWVAPNEETAEMKIGDATLTSSYKDNPPPADGRKVVFSDTDHLWGHGGNYRWVWKSFLRGLNPIFMDPWEPLPGKKDEEKTTPWLFDWGGIAKDDRNYPEWGLIRQHMGYTRKFAERIDLAAMPPRSELSSTRYCLANPGQEYLVYFPESMEAQIDLRGVTGEFAVEWFIPLQNRTIIGPRTLRGGGFAKIMPPLSLDAVLCLKKK